MDVHDSRRSLGIRRVDNFDMELSQQSKRAKEEERRVHKKNPHENGARKYFRANEA